MTRPAPRSYKPEFKQMAVAMVLDQGKAVASTACERGIPAYTLHNWVGKAREERGIEPPAPATADDDGPRRRLVSRRNASVSWRRKLRS